ncbi:MAG: ATP-binding protein [Euryarchaeota archaeon]|nr:ATP-binding protein [Euryarchaeota archaeon]
MLQQFVDRQNELRLLEDTYEQNKSSLIIIYGRRRIGKTELVKQFIKDRKHIYFLADTRMDIDNIKEMQRAVSFYVKNPLFERVEFTDWVDLFRESDKLLKEKVIIVIDEFPYLIESNKAIPSIFQKIWDLILSEKEVCLVLLGSSISMMESYTLDYRAPLYGRRTAQLQLQTLKFRYLGRFLPYAMEDLVRVYGVTDGIPLYILKFDSGLNFEENVLENVFRVGKFLYQEAEILLKEELRETARYFSILKAIAHGKHRFGDIANFTELDKGIISRYLGNLATIRLIRKEYPVTQKKEVRNARYIFNDNYLNFWFRYVYPYRSLIEEGRTTELFDLIREDFNSYLGFVFEKICREFLWEQELPFAFTKLGRWWHKDKEIDMVALNEERREIAFFEVKWSDLELSEASRIIKELKKKSEYVDWNKGDKVEYFGLIAKRLDGKRELREAGYLCYDLLDMR